MITSFVIQITDSEGATLTISASNPQEREDWTWTLYEYAKAIAGAGYTLNAENLYYENRYTKELEDAITLSLEDSVERGFDWLRSRKKEKSE